MRRLARARTLGEETRVGMAATFARGEALLTPTSPDTVVRSAARAHGRRGRRADAGDRPALADRGAAARPRPRARRALADDGRVRPPLRRGATSTSRATSGCAPAWPSTTRGCTRRRRRARRAARRARRRLAGDPPHAQPRRPARALAGEPRALGGAPGGRGGRAPPPPPPRTPRRRCRARRQRARLDPGLGQGRDFSAGDRARSRTSGGSVAGDRERAAGGARAPDRHDLQRSLLPPSLPDIHGLEPRPATAPAARARSSAATSTTCSRSTTLGGRRRRRLRQGRRGRRADRDGPLHDPRRGGAPRGPAEVLVGSTTRSCASSRRPLLHGPARAAAHPATARRSGWPAPATRSPAAARERRVEPCLPRAPARHRPRRRARVTWSSAGRRDRLLHRRRDRGARPRRHVRRRPAGRDARRGRGRGRGRARRPRDRRGAGLQRGAPQDDLAVLVLRVPRS